MTPGPLAWTRTVHFASTIQLAGIFGFLFFVVDPVFRRAPASELPAVCKLRTQLIRLAWISLAPSIASGGLWLVLVAAEMSGETLGHVLSTGLLATVLTGTQFGRDWDRGSGMTRPGWTTRPSMFTTECGPCSSQSATIWLAS